MTTTANVFQNLIGGNGKEQKTARTSLIPILQQAKFWDIFRFLARLMPMLPQHEQLSKSGDWYLPLNGVKFSFAQENCPNSTRKS